MCNVFLFINSSILAPWTGEEDLARLRMNISCSLEGVQEGMSEVTFLET